MQFENDSFQNVLKEHGLDEQPINHVVISRDSLIPFKCSSAEVVNGVFD